ncbi:M50 family metallopeptidase [Ignisphaera sp. 4213-co]|uniref:M50 family metallopeptidase n=1 Tax=Ignisphaera cupida TaxID=3050454 RepID=A0ABD4Z8G3_9CREN|nr:M50 family metallopeptidase [Ignisphaera sp. 4213-co]MDK6029222.1 M50 family metallopeptidase [Ignisphaera sp. 4213-co]
MNFRELVDLFISASVVFIAFSFQYLISFNYKMTTAYLLATITAFVFHELAHRNVARSKGVFAAYKAWYFGLLISLLLSIASRGSIVFVVPGAVEIYMPIYIPSIESSIAVAGPLTNAIISLICIPLTKIHGVSVYASVVGYVNSFLAFFNLLPIPPLDGYKVIRHDITKWVFAMALSIASLIFYWFFE